MTILGLAVRCAHWHRNVYTINDFTSFTVQESFFILSGTSKQLYNNFVNDNNNENGNGIDGL